MTHALIVEDDADAAEMMAALIATEDFTVATAEHAARRAPPDRAAAARHRAARPAAARRQRHGAVRRRQDLIAQRRGRADHRPRQPRDLDPGAAPGRRRLPRSSRSTSSSCRASCRASTQAVGAEGRAADAARTTARRAAASATCGAARRRCSASTSRSSRVAGTAVTVFITGESGTGKELVARTVHDLSRRRKQPFLAVNCGAISPQPDRERALRPREGQLHRRRAPAPGLLRARQRRHAVPRRDHRDAARAAGQAAARARDRHLHARRLDPGRSETDVRVIAATNRDPSEAVAAGKLREDLLYRLNVFPIELPPLRERAEDIAAARRALPRARSASARAQRKRFAPARARAPVALPLAGQRARAAQRRAARLRHGRRRRSSPTSGCRATPRRRRRAGRHGAASALDPIARRHLAGRGRAPADPRHAGALRPPQGDAPPPCSASA